MQLSQIPVQTPTPFYYYNLELLKKTVQAAKSGSAPYGYRVHYAVKANANPVLLRLISQQGLGADCVSGNEIRQALECGFPADTIVYAGVGHFRPIFRTGTSSADSFRIGTLDRRTLRRSDL